MGLCRMVPEFWFGTGSCICPSNCPFLVSCSTQPLDDRHVSYSVPFLEILTWTRTRSLFWLQLCVKRSEDLNFKL